MGALKTWCGALAQLGEHLLCKQGVSGSIPLGSTSLVTTDYSRDEDMKFASPAFGTGWRYFAGSARFFDIVNGFLIDAVAHGIGLPPVMDGGRHCALLQMCNLAEIIVRTIAPG